MYKEDLKRKFAEYIYSNYDMKDIGISRKYYHSLRVMDIANLLAVNEKFNENDIELSNIVGLLHDYGRFPQWKNYKTYNDLISIDHGDLAIKLLFENNEIERFNIKHEYYDEIYDAIKYHNKLDITDDLSKHNKLLCKLIRDADKLDILYLYGTDMTLFKEDDKNISVEVKKSFYKNKQIDKKIIKSKNDKILLDLALVFDLNFNYSYKYIKDNKLIENLFKRLNNEELFKEYFEYIYEYVDEKNQEKKLTYIRKD